MDWQTYLFSTAGRIGRAHYWLALMIYTAVSLVAIAIGIVLATSMSDAATVVLYVGAGVIFLGLFFSSIAVAIKRLHDRDRSGWWVVPFLVLPGLLNGASAGVANPTTVFVLQIASAALAIWGLIELGFLRGTIGANRFGPDPLEAPQAEPLPQ